MAFSSISDLWNKSNIRGSVILSLLLQVFLILFAPFRKKIANRNIIFLLWLAYLMADSVAIYGIGLISHSQGNSHSRLGEVNEALQAFWASFLLLHLGGPDTITAFSLEDSSLWGRHLLTLIFQVSAAIYLFLQIFPNDKSLVIPTMLVFFSGVIKNAERTLALNLSSLPRLRELMLSQFSSFDFEKLLGELAALGGGYSDEAKLEESTVVKHAYFFFASFKVFIGDLMLGRTEHERSHIYFNNVSPVDALRVISAELQFMYEVLHTKALAIRSKWSYFFRFVAFTDLAMALVLFNRLEKHRIPELDVEITRSLLFGGMALDVIALFMLVFSDWTVAEIMWNRRSSKLYSFFGNLVHAMDYQRMPRFATCEAEPNANAIYEVLDTPFVFRRWSESIPACNLLFESLKKSPRMMYKRDRCWGVVAFSDICSLPFPMAEKIISCFHQTRDKITGRKFPMIVTPRYVSKNPFIKKLWIFIFKEVQRKSKNVQNPIQVREIMEARGGMFLRSISAEIDCSNLLKHFTEINYDSSIITCHIATEICYNREERTARNDEREFSKILSDYTLYLLLQQPDVVSAVAGVAQIISAVALGELARMARNIEDATKDIEQLCKILYEHRFNIEFNPTSQLKNGIELAREMERLGERKWKVMSGVWVEMLCYAASHIKGEAHVQVLSKGGELLAFVWLLMAHFGCFYNAGWGLYDKSRDEMIDMYRFERSFFGNFV